MRNAKLDEAQAGIRIAGGIINNLTSTDDTTLMAESKEKLKSPLMTVKEESEKAGLKFNIQKINIVASGPITSWQIEGEKLKTVKDLIFLGTKNITVTAAMKLKRHLLLGRKTMSNLDSILKSRDITLLTNVHKSKLWFFQ